MAYRVIGEDGKLHWVNNQFRPAYIENGVSYYYASFVDLDQQKEAEQDRLKAKTMYEAAVEEAKLVVWEYDIRAHRITMAENEFTSYDYRKFGLPRIIDRVPESLFPYMDENSLPAFKALYKAIEGGAAKANCEVWYKMKPGVEPRCERISYTTVYDEEGKPIKAFGIGQNITSKKRDEEEYERIRNQYIGNLSGSVSSVQLNLSKNLYVSGYSSFPEVQTSLAKPTAEGHFLAAIASISDPKRKADIAAEFTCPNLLRLFEKGVTNTTEEYPIRSSQGETLWIRTTLAMMQNPHTGEVEGVTYSKEITSEKENEAILDLLTKEGSDFVGVINVSKSLFTMHDGVWKCAEIANGQSAPLDEMRTTLVSHYVLPSEQVAFSKATELPSLARALKEKGMFVLPYDYQEGAGSPVLKKTDLVPLHGCGTRGNFGASARRD